MRNCYQGVTFSVSLNACIHGAFDHEQNSDAMPKRPRISSTVIVPRREPNRGEALRKHDEEATTTRVSLWAFGLDAPGLFLFNFLFHSILFCLFFFAAAAENELGQEELRLEGDEGTQDGAIVHYDESEKDTTSAGVVKARIRIREQEKTRAPRNRRSEACAHTHPSTCLLRMAM